MMKTVAALASYTVLLLLLLLLGCCFTVSLAKPAHGEDGESSTTGSTFPVFFRSRFNPRLQKTNERLLAVPEDVDLLPPLRSESPALSASINRTVTQSPSPSTTPPEPLPDEEECGLVGRDIDTYPWIAVLEHGGPQSGTAGSRKRTLSKGVLIDRRHVLTTVSSVHNSHPSWVVTGVRLGDAPTRRHNATRRTIQRFPIETVYLHESKDIAVIRLADGGVRNVTDHIRPICLPREDYRLESFRVAAHVCQRVVNVTRESGRASRSRLHMLELIGAEDCNRLLRPYGARLPVKNFCARDVDSDNCTGALGGPAVASIRGRYHVLGLRSYIQTEKAVDDPNVPSIYVRVGGLRKWLSAVIRTETDACCVSAPSPTN